MLIVYIYVALASYNIEYLTLPLASIETIIDEAANVAVIDDGGQIGKTKSGRRKRELPGSGIQEWKATWSHGTDAVMDVPLGGVCEVLYGAGREIEDSDDAS